MEGSSHDFRRTPRVKINIKLLNQETFNLIYSMVKLFYPIYELWYETN